VTKPRTSRPATASPNARNSGRLAFSDILLKIFEIYSIITSKNDKTAGAVRLNEVDMENRRFPAKRRPDAREAMRANRGRRKKKRPGGRGSRGRLKPLKRLDSDKEMAIMHLTERPGYAIVQGIGANSHVRPFQSRIH
jgi:hypothetical protein